MAEPHDWDARSYDESFRFVADRAAELVTLLDPRPGERILDLGCGTGRLTAVIASRGASVVGVDRDAAMIEAAREQFPDVEFAIGDGEALDLAGPFDAVFSNAALHWMTRPEVVLHGVARLLRPGGRFVAELGGHGNVAVIEGALREALARQGVPAERQPRVWYFPSEAEYGSLLQQHGLDVRELALFDRPTPLEGGERGLAEWLRMFAAPYFATLPEDRVDAAIADVKQTTRARLWRDGGWVVDYRRLRFVAVRTDERVP